MRGGCLWQFSTDEFGHHSIPTGNLDPVTRQPLIPPAPSLTPGQVQRYSRHLLLDEIGAMGQRRLKNARVLVVGAGGLAAPVLAYLAAAGVGHLTVIDDDVVESSNLQRQVLFTENDLGSPKSTAARAAVAGINGEVHVQTLQARFEVSNALELAADHDVVVDTTDNFATRYLINDTCVLLGLPLVWASVERFEGRVSVWLAGEGPCYRCIFPQPPPDGAVPSCAEAGVLGLLPGTMGAIQAGEVIKLLLGLGEPLIGRMVMHDALAGSWQTLPMAADPACPICGIDPSITALSAPKQQIPVPKLTVHELRDLLAVGRARVIDIRTDAERDIVALPFAEHLEVDDVGIGSLGASDGRTLVLHCKSGARSSAAVRSLLQDGYAGPVASLEGGILAWAQQIDPTLAQY